MAANVDERNRDKANDTANFTACPIIANLHNISTPRIVLLTFIPYLATVRWRWITLWRIVWLRGITWLRRISWLANFIWIRRIRRLVTHE
jgi:hypothetical protein